MTEHLIGVISDTHGLLRPEAVKALEGVELIIHAGDIGDLRPVTHIRAPRPGARGPGQHRPGRLGRRPAPDPGGGGGGRPALRPPRTLPLDLDPAAAGLAAVIFGHSHRPHLEPQNGVLFLNPGSAGPRRFTLPVTLARIKLEGNSLHPELVELKV